MRVAIITANTDIYKGTESEESGEAVKLVAEEAGLEVVFMPGHFHWTEKYCQLL